jgi:hypothetical protein
MHTRHECVGDLLRVLTRRTLWDTYLSVCTAGYCLFIWLGVASLCLQGNKNAASLPKEKERNKNEEKNEAKAQPMTVLIEKGLFFCEIR